MKIPNFVKNIVIGKSNSKVATVPPIELPNLIEDGTSVDVKLMREAKSVFDTMTAGDEFKYEIQTYLESDTLASAQVGVDKFGAAMSAEKSRGQIKNTKMSFKKGKDSLHR